MLPKAEYLEQDSEEGIYLYYQHSKYPLYLKVEDNVLTIRKLFKNIEVKTKEFPIKAVGKMSREQIEGYILDCLELF